jgi:DNA-binding transcriptional MerR regulator
MDPAFVWQTPSPPPPPRGWVNIDDAARSTGVPATTIRNWARKQKIASKLDGNERMVLRAEVVERARHLGRLESQGQTPVGVPAASPPEPAVRPPDPPVPEGSMLVPIDEWRRLLNQLGNLHEAGQRLAEARERAARAETESQFLKERVRELRTRLEAVEEPTPESVAQPEPAPQPPVEQGDPGPFWLYLVRRWGSRSR